MPQDSFSHEVISAITELKEKGGIANVFLTKTEKGKFLEIILNDGTTIMIAARRGSKIHGKCFRWTEVIIDEVEVINE